MRDVRMMVASGIERVRESDRDIEIEIEGERAEEI